jgi:hypothetical protein
MHTGQGRSSPLSSFSLEMPSQHTQSVTNLLSASQCKHGGTTINLPSWVLTSSARAHPATPEVSALVTLYTLPPLSLGPREHCSS